MSSLKIERTEFPCPLCGKIVFLKVDDPQSYLSRTEHEKYFGMQLATYRVAHQAAGERHVISVLVDHKGYYRGLIDAFAEKKHQETKPLTQAAVSETETQWRVLDINRLSDYHHELPSIDFFLFFNTEEKLVVPLHYNKKFNFLEFTTLLLKKLDEARKIYGDEMKHLQVSIADKIVHTWTQNNNIVAIGLQHAKVEALVNGWIERFLSVPQLLDQLHHHAEPIFLVLKILDQQLMTPEEDPSLLLRLVTDDLLFTRIYTPYLDHIERIVERTSREYPIAKEILSDLLHGKKTVIEILHDDRYLKHFKEIFAMIDFINRRKLLG